MNTRQHQLYFGKVMPFTTPDGAPHPASFWIVADNPIVPIEARLVIRFYGYHSVEAFDAGAQPMQGAVKEYPIDGDKWLPTVMQPLNVPAGTPWAAAHLGKCWEIALTTPDGPPPAQLVVDGVPQVEADGTTPILAPDTRVSFFAGAADAN